MDRGGAGAVLATVLAGQVLPLAVGMWLRSRRPARADQVQYASGRVADLLLVGLTCYVVASTVDQLGALPPAAFGTMAVLVVASLAAYGTPGLDGPPARRTVATTTAVRNLSLGLLVAGQSTAPGLVSLTLIAYSLLMYGFAALALVGMRRRVAAVPAGS